MDNWELLKQTKKAGRIVGTIARPKALRIGGADSNAHKNILKNQTATRGTVD